MNIINSIIGVILLVILVIIGYKLGQIIIELNSPVTPVINETKLTLPLQPSSNTTLRWNHFPLTVYIDSSSVKSEYVDNFRESLELWQSSTDNFVSFFVVTSIDADITVEWVPRLKENSTDALGNTDLKFINISGVGLIQNAKIELLTKSDSRQLSRIDMTNLALHEIGHALGLSHSSNEEDIMYPILTIPSNAIKEISATDLQELQKSYAQPAKPDLRIAEVNVTKATLKRFGTTFYLVDISMIIENVGLTDAASVVLEIDTENEKVKQENLPSMDVGNKLSVIFGNVRVNNEFSTIKLVLDSANLIDELNEENNFVMLKVT